MLNIGIIPTNLAFILAYCIVYTLLLERISCDFTIIEFIQPMNAWHVWLKTKPYSVLSPCREVPSSGNIITFLQFLLIALHGFFFTTKCLTVKPAIPIRLVQLKLCPSLLFYSLFTFPGQWHDQNDIQEEAGIFMFCLISIEINTWICPSDYCTGYTTSPGWSIILSYKIVNSIPRCYGTMVSYFIVVSLLNNIAPNFHIPMPLHMIFRSVSCGRNSFFSVYKLVMFID
jgi:hypothetical protein